MALPLTLGVMLALTTSVTAVLQFSSANARGASLALSGQDAIHTAEDGFNQATSIVASDPNNSAALPSCPPAEPTLGSTTWCGTKTGNVWAVKSVSRMANPTGPSAAPVSRTVEAQFELVNTTDLSAWQGVLTWGQDEQPLMQDGAEVRTPLYVKPSGTFPVVIKGNSKYLGEYLAIKGRLRIEDTSSVGLSTDLVDQVLVESGCNSVSSCGTGQRVWTSAFSNVVPDLPKPTVDFAYWRINAKPGPGTVGTGPGKWPNGCTTYSGSPPSFTSSTFNLMPSSSYDCRVDVNGDGVLEGQLKWTAGTPGTLTVKGDIYADGSMDLNRYGVVSGKAALYLGGKIIMQGDTSSLCGQADTAPGRPLCAAAWDPNTAPNILMMYSKSSADDAVDIKNGFEFQGGMFTEGKFWLQNDAKFKGPLVSKKLEVKNTADIHGFTPLTNTLPGIPGNSGQALRLVAGSWRG